MKFILPLAVGSWLMLARPFSAVVTDGTTSDTVVLGAPAKENVVQFPEDKSLGSIFILGKGLLSEMDWNEIAEARGRWCFRPTRRCG